MGLVQVKSNQGLNWFVSQSSSMLMDIALLKLEPQEEATLDYLGEECLVLLLTGKAIFKTNELSAHVSRESLFFDAPHTIHVDKNDFIHIISESKAEFIVMKTKNQASFISKYYGPGDFKIDVFGQGLFNDTATRQVSTIVDADINDQSKLVIGELIGYPGQWSSYIPHHHPQPEVYYYRFDKPQGFGAGFIGEDVFKITDNSALCIEGGNTHPHVTAPGYPVYYTWMIRHFDDALWKDRINEPQHEWMLEKNVKIWGTNDESDL